MAKTIRAVVLAVGLASVLAACGMFEAPTEQAFEFMDITTLAHQDSTIDFEGLSEGLIVDGVSGPTGLYGTATFYGTGGISGYDTGGFVDIHGVNPEFDDDTINTALVFDATCEPGGTPADCSGEDYDLFDPDLGNILVIAEDLVDDDEDGLVDDPDDADTRGESFRFDFSNWTTSGSVTIGTFVMNIIDVEPIEDGAQVTLYANSDFTGEILAIPLPVTGDGETGTVEQPLNVSGVASMTVALQGSGGIDNIRISADTPMTGCTPGFWRNWTGDDRSPGPQPNAWPYPYTTDTPFDDVFGPDPYGGDLYDVVTARGGGVSALGRHTVAALLNAAHPFVSYPLTEAEVIDMFDNVDRTSRSAVNDLKDTFEAYNEAGCPLSQNVYADPRWDDSE